MSFDARSLFELLPAIHRIRDAELAQAQGLERGPLEELMAVLAEQVGVAEEGLDQFYDDLFIETCADWVVPYIGDLIGYRSLHGVGADTASSRAEVAHTIALRRRKGTALVLEQLARDVTGWDAGAVEYFDRLCTTQYMNHPRPHNRQAPDLRYAEPLEWIGTAFETAARTVDVRRIESGRGRHNIPNVGLHLWRIRAYSRTAVPAHREGPGRYRVSPLGHDVPLYNRPVAEDDISHLAEPDNVPSPLSRRRLAAHLDLYFGARATAGGPVDNPAPSLVVSVNGTEIERPQVRICHLGDDAGGWAHTPPPNGIYAIDPVLGRVAVPSDAPDPADVRVTWHEGFSADIGGGEYERESRLPVPPAAVTVVRVPDDHPTIAAGLAAVAGDGVILVTDNSRYEESLAVAVVPDGIVEIRAANGCRPTLVLADLTVSGGAAGACTLNGLLIAGTPLRVPAGGGNALARLRIVDCTLVPGIALGSDGSPTQPGAPSLELGVASLEIEIERSIVGGLRVAEHARVSAVDSVIDATAMTEVAFAAVDHHSAGGTLSLEACTVVGKVHASEFGLVSNSILLAALAPLDVWTRPVRTTRKQAGCVRFSWLPFDSIVPTRFRCQPDSTDTAGRVAPRFTSFHYGTPAYGQLTRTTPPEILRGAEDESEMGVFHHLYGAQREANLRIRLAEFLRVGLHAGVFYAS